MHVSQLRVLFWRIYSTQFRSINQRMRSILFCNRSGATDYATRATKVLPNTTMTTFSAFGLSSIHDVRDLRTFIDKDDAAIKNKTLVGLIFIYASWVMRCKRDGSAPTYRSMLSSLSYSLIFSSPKNESDDSSIKALSNNDVHWIIGSLQIDESDDSFDNYLGDSNDDTHEDFPCPPEELPVLAVVIQLPKAENSRIRYLTDIKPSDLLRYCNNNQGERQQTPIPRPVISSWAKVLRNSIKKVLDEGDGEALRIFVAGSSVGKSSVCLGMLGTLVHKMGYRPSSLAYIKPAAQSDIPKIVQKCCDSVGIQCVAVGPAVCSRNVSAELLASEKRSREEILGSVGLAVDKVARHKRVLLIDGVGFPAVGSISGTDNASVAKACGHHYAARNDENDETVNYLIRKKRYPLPVLIIGDGSGVGAAVDSFNMNAMYFETTRVPVVGAVFNKISEEGLDSLEACKAQVTGYFEQNGHQSNLDRKAFGFMPYFQELQNVTKTDTRVQSTKNIFRKFSEVFEKHVDAKGIIEAANKLKRVALEKAEQKQVMPYATLMKNLAKLDDDGVPLLDPNATLSPHPRTIHQMWNEYAFGIDGRKPAKYFTSSERGKVKYKYHRRKVVWDVIAKLVMAGWEPAAACDKIYEVYGRDKAVSAIINQMKEERKKGDNLAVKIADHT